MLAGEEIVATFVTDSQGLAGTSWEVLNYNNGRQAVVGLLPDTEISADFGEREITGDGGCNQYFAGYSVNGNAIDIGTPARTFRFCPEPAGVMDQETEYPDRAARAPRPTASKATCCKCARPMMRLPSS